MDFERHYRWNTLSVILIATLLFFVFTPAVNSQENETNSSLPYVDPLVWQSLNESGWAITLVTINNVSSSIEVVISILPPAGFQLIEENPENSSFTANISWQAFDILANDTNVTGIYLWINEAENQTNQSKRLPLIARKVIEELNESEWVKIGAFVETGEALELILSELNESEFQLKKISYEYQPSFSGNISRSGFEKLRFNPNITRILSGNFTVKGDGGDNTETIIEQIDEQPLDNIGEQNNEEDVKPQFFKPYLSGVLSIISLLILILAIVTLNRSKIRAAKK